jgi:hypothetical protein
MIKKIAPRQHGYYEIRLWMSGNRIGGRPFLRDVPVLPQREAETVEAIIQLIARDLDEHQARLRTARAHGQIATVEEFEEALLALDAIMTDGQRRMLGAFLRDPRHARTATQLAEAAGYAEYSGANLWLGKLASEIAPLIGYNRGQNGEVTASHVIADEADGSRTAAHPEFIFKLREEVVAALNGRAKSLTLPPLSPA